MRIRAASLAKVGMGPGGANSVSRSHGQSLHSAILAVGAVVGVVARYCLGSVGSSGEAELLV